ncbi:MAG: flagellar protein FlgN [Nitrospirales bacterium]|nr:flagellar protein FlgN [Nitrospirales bacterium]
MTQSYENLLAILEKEFSLCTRLMELLQQEREVVASLDPDALEQLLRDKEVISSGIRVCDEARERVLEELGFKDMTICEVSRRAEAVYREPLASLASRFTSIIHRISELNSFNSMLIEKSLYHIKTSYNFLSTFEVSAPQKISVEA